MKRTLLSAIFICGSLIAAHADTDIYDDITGQHRSDDLMAADAAYCSDRLGAPQNGTRTSAAYKACMRGRGWKFLRTVHTPATYNGALVCSARVLNMQDTGWGLNHHSYVNLTLRVTPPGGKPYVVTIGREVSNHNPPHVGSTLKVTCDPANPSEVHAIP